MLSALLLLAAAAPQDPVWVGKFNGSGAPPAPWRVVRTGRIKPTVYRVAAVESVTALEARVDNSMAMLARPVTVDLGKTPMLCWSWHVDSIAVKGDMRRKSGDDYAARVYVAFDMPDSALSACTKLMLSVSRKLYGVDVPDAAVIYVWDHRNAVGTARRSAYTNRSHLIVAETGAARVGKWVNERVDVGADFARAFGGKPGRLVQLAVAADGDNTRRSGRAAFANIHFVGRDQKCAG
jgi:hypothetical protein